MDRKIGVASGAVVIPKEGMSFDIIQGGVHLAFDARAEYINAVKRDAEWFLQKSAQMNKGSATPQDSEGFIEHRIEQHGFRPNRRYEFDLTDRLDPKRKAEIFGLPIVRMREISREVADLPDNLIDRIRVVNEESFWSLLLWQEGVVKFDSYSTLAVTFGNGLCAINEGAVNAKVLRDGGEFEGIVRLTGVHELWHSVEYAEDWLLPDFKYRPGRTRTETFARRRGLVTKRPGEKGNVGLSSVGEGFTDLLTNEVLKIDGYPFFESYPQEMILADELKNVIGLETLLSAVLTKKGFREYVTLINQIYGKGAMRRLCRALEIDNGGGFFDSMIGQENTFDNTRDFLETGKLRDLDEEF